MSHPVDLRKALRSFRFAGAGIASLFRYENNARIHLLAAALVVGAGFWLQLSRMEWCVILTQVGLVWAAEAFNTALEKLADLVSPDYHPTIKAVKDVSAAGVLLVALVAAVVGTLIFLPKLLALF
ncbi:diacylglycerol kinase family protein [Rhabdobacter roseus]|uniref:Diacylglycerol kinase (ATP) n=1 Tax=Rhabdobacter roseus TaxID=1655419 RepID=A0A840THR3_9BACT|nr:diacylglycerol kinase family protein [Rhabdobacter roseus]MBB5282821.1 diacylglycerol kinase (ATP) [Rhabdobacter roseus]